MSKLIVDIPPELHRALKQRALDSMRTLKEMVSELLEDYLRREPDDVRRGTGLCGAWEDDRSPEAIIRDIKAHRVGWAIRRRG